MEYYPGAQRGDEAGGHKLAYVYGETQGTVVVCGSLFLVGEVLALTEGAGAIDPSEALRAH